MQLPRRVLITGGAGLIGSHIADRLLERGHEIVILDNFSTGRLANIAHLQHHQHCRIVQGDILDAALVESVVASTDYVFHLAAAVGVANVVSDPLHVILTNVHGTENVLRSCYGHGRGVAVASSSEIYGKGQKIPFSEDDDRVLGPATVQRWAYSASKALDEHIAYAYARQGLRTVIVRYFNTYGPRMHERGDGQVVARFAALAIRGEPLTVHGDGEQTRCFTFVDDTVRATILAAECDPAVGHALNIGSEHEVSINGLAALIRERTGSRSSVMHISYEEAYGPGFEDTRRRVPDLTRARRLLGFEPRVDLYDGLERTLPWCREHYGSHGPEQVAR